MNKKYLYIVECVYKCIKMNIKILEFEAVDIDIELKFEEKCNKWL